MGMLPLIIFTDKLRNERFVTVQIDLMDKWSASTRREWGIDVVVDRCLAWWSGPQWDDSLWWNGSRQ